MAQDQVRSCVVALYGVTEKLKSENQMEWVTKMNNTRIRVTEIINADLICI